MARRKRKEEETEWVPPEFDEVAYMRKEIEGARTAIATIIWAAVGAIVAFLLYSVYPVLAFFAGIAVGFGMYFVFPLIGIKTDGFKRRDWTGHGVTYFFSWLAFWIILLNPPFGDFTLPTIQAISVSPYSSGFPGDLPCYGLPADNTVTLSMGANTSIYILFRATDNVGLARLTVNVTPSSQPPFFAGWMRVSGNSRCAGQTTQPYAEGTYNATIPGTASSYTVEIIAVDPSGQGARVDFHILRGP